MKKKIMLGMVVLSLFILVGCNNKESGKKDEIETKKDRNLHTCIKKDIEQTNKANGDKYVEDIEFIAKVDDDKKLQNYTMNYTYRYETKEVCESTCDIKTRWNDDINAKKYSGLVRKTECNCNDKTIKEISEYDIANIDKFLRSDISQLKSDDTFDLDTWLSFYEAKKYKCD